MKSYDELLARRRLRAERNGVEAAKVAHQTRLALDYQAGVDQGRQHRDGVVVTPVEVVDFQIRGLIDSLAARGVTLADPRVKILDPFGGTGIYLARLLQLAPLDPAGKMLLALRCRMVEIDHAACVIARANLTQVMREETGSDFMRPVVICADTFTLGDEVWELKEGHCGHDSDDTGR